MIPRQDGDLMDISKSNGKSECWCGKTKEKGRKACCINDKMERLDGTADITDGGALIRRWNSR